jgi:hypothetical protein
VTGANSTTARGGLASPERAAISADLSHGTPTRHDPLMPAPKLTQKKSSKGPVAGAGDRSSTYRHGRARPPPSHRPRRPGSCGSRVGVRRAELVGAEWG